jgi:hypothetical protein
VLLQLSTGSSIIIDEMLPFNAIISFIFVCMKKLKQQICLAICGLLFLSAAVAQQPERCATVHYNKMREQKNPQLALDRTKTEALIARLAREHKFKSSQSIITIPVVVHVIYRTNIENIPDAQIQSQIDVLNEDFGRMNADAAQTPSAFSSIAANSGIQFCLATRKPNGDWTNGIERRQCPDTFWYPYDAMKFYNTGGLNAWDPNSYLNIWVCNLISPYLGYSIMPSNPIDTLIDGLVIKSRCFGRTGYVYPPYNKGRTTTHEIGHWLGLYHNWGDDGGSCLGTDLIYDTPNQADATSGCLTFPHYDACSFPTCVATQDTSNPCSPFGAMFMNYMDYTDDACMNMFTQGQANFMINTLNVNRSSLYNSLGCSPAVGIEEISSENGIGIFPNPAYNEISISCHAISNEKVWLSVCDISGKEILRNENYFCDENIPVDISSLSNGIYFLKLRNRTLSAASRFTVIR